MPSHGLTPAAPRWSRWPLTLPPVLLVIFGVAAFSVALGQKLELAEAISNGGRVLAADRGDTDPCKTAYLAIDSAAPTLSSSGIKLVITLNGVSSGSASATPSCAGASGQPNTNMVKGGSATISATYTCSINSFRYTYPGCNLAASLTENVE